MLEGWSLMKRRSSRDEAEPRQAAAKDPRGPAQLAGGGPLDALGQQSESVRERVNRMAERLDEIRSLSDEFGLIVGPLNDFVDQHAASRARLMELEALLAREREVSANARADYNALQVTSTKISNEYQDALAVLSDRDEVIRRQDVEVTELRIRVADLKSHADSLDARLFAEADRAKALADDNAALKQEVASAEDAGAAAERNLSETRERLGLTEAEASRLQALAETLSLKIAGLSRIAADLEPQLQVARSTAALAQDRYLVEQASRQKSEAALESARASHEMELASLSMKIDGLNAHVFNTDKLTAHLREQLHEKMEAFRVTEKALRDATADKVSVVRRLESAQEAAARTGAQLQNSQRANVDLSNRVDMLAKAVAAKDQAADAANRKSATLLDRIESINARFALERSEWEATHRRMIEELQNERAERSLAQGALDIARKSRSSLLAQYTALKRRAGAGEGRPMQDVHELEAEGSQPSDSNVMAFTPPEPGV